MSNFKNFMSSALSNPNNFSDAQLVQPTNDLDTALNAISDFVNGALSQISLTSYVYLSGNAISPSGRKMNERLHLHPGFLYFNEAAAGIELVNAEDINYKLPYNNSLQYVNLLSAEELIGFYIEVTATDLTDGIVSLASTADSVVCERAFSVRTGETVGIFVPSRTHLVDEDKSFGFDGTGTALDPFKVTANEATTVNTSDAILTPRVFDESNHSLTLSYQNVYISIEAISNKFPYLKDYFS